MFFKIAHQEEAVVKKIFSNHLTKNVSLFMDVASTPEELSINPKNILVVNEPNEYFGLHDWAITNRSRFSVILTWSAKILNNCPNAKYMAFGDSWLKPDQYEKEYEKTFHIAHLCGKLKLTYGHMMRHEILFRKNEIKHPVDFYHTIGNRHDIENARIGKEQVFAPAGFGICIENVSNKGWFTEKILDCFLLRTIPIYWGCSDIHDYFDSSGIIKFENVDDAIEKINALTPDFYADRLSVIEKNYELAKNYLNFPQRIHNTLVEQTDIFE